MIPQIPARIPVCCLCGKDGKRYFHPERAIYFDFCDECRDCLQYMLADPKNAKAKLVAAVQERA